jgi:hypothetical protein
VIGTAVSEREDGREEPISIPDDLADIVKAAKHRQSVAEFQNKAQDLLTEACEAIGAKPGAADYFTSRLVSVEGQPHIKLRDGSTAVISSAVVQAELPPALLSNRQAKRQDEFGDLEVMIREQERKVSDAQRLFREAGGRDNAMLSIVSRERAKLQELRQRRDGILAEKEAERNPASPTRGPSPAELGKLDAMRHDVARLKAQAARSNANQDLVAFSTANRELKQYAQQIGAT